MTGSLSLNQALGILQAIGEYPWLSEDTVDNKWALEWAQDFTKLPSLISDVTTTIKRTWSLGDKTDIELRIALAISKLNEFVQLRPDVKRLIIEAVDNLSFSVLMLRRTPEKFIKASEELISEGNRFSFYYPSLESMAQKLHDENKAIFNTDPPIAINQKTGEICSTSEQLIKALEIARTHFAEKLTLPETNKEKVLASRLIQIVMLGKAALTAMKLPKTPFILTINNLSVLSNPAKNLLPKDSSYLLHALTKFAENSLESNLVASLNAFIADNIERSSLKILMRNYFDSFVSEAPESPDLKLRIGLKGIQKGHFNFFKMIAIFYLDFLHTHPEKAKEIIIQNRSSKILKIAQTHFSDKNDKTSSIFSDACFRKMLQPCMAPWMRGTASQNQKQGMMRNEFEKLLKASTLSKEMINLLQQDLSKLGFECSVAEIEPLVRIKILELMILLNQSALGPATALLSQNLNALKLLKFSLNMRGTHAQYQFNHPQFDQFISQAHFEAYITENDAFYHEFIFERSSTLSLFSVMTTLEVSSISGSKDQNHVLQLIDQVAFSYQTPTAIIQKLSNDFGKVL